MHCADSRGIDMKNKLKIVTDCNIGEIIEEMEITSLIQAHSVDQGYTAMSTMNPKGKLLSGFTDIWPALLKKTRNPNQVILRLLMFFAVAAVVASGTTHHLIQKQNKEHAIASTITSTKIKISLNGVPVETVDLKQTISESYECSAQIQGKGRLSAYSLDMDKACSLLMDKIKIESAKKPLIEV